MDNLCWIFLKLEMPWAILTLRGHCFLLPSGGKSTLYTSLNVTIPLHFDVERAKLVQGIPRKFRALLIACSHGHERTMQPATRTNCAVLDAYHVVKKGAISTKDLVENAPYHVPFDLELVPQITLEDLDLAGNLSPLTITSAAAFRLLRPTRQSSRNSTNWLFPASHRPLRK